VQRQGPFSAPLFNAFAITQTAANLFAFGFADDHATARPNRRIRADNANISRLGRVGSVPGFQRLPACWRTAFGTFLTSLPVASNRRRIDAFVWPRAGAEA